MNVIRFSLCVVCFSLFFIASEVSSSAQPPTKPPQSKEWKSLFNGRNLDGWYLKVKPDEHNLQSWTALNGVLVNIPPSENASLPAGHWQSFHAIFHKAEIENSSVMKKPRITVYHHGKKVIDNIAIEGLTGAALIDKVVEKGPTYLQGNHGMVFYRNIFYKTLEIRCAHAPIRTGKNLEKTSVSTAGDWGDTYTRRSEAELKSEI